MTIFVSAQRQIRVGREVICGMIWNETWRIYCAGYIEAAVILIELMDKQSFCLLTETTPEDVVKATVASLQAHPDQRKFLLANVMVAAVQAQWPCRSR